jgi:hypothetical protein
MPPAPTPTYSELAIQSIAVSRQKQNHSVLQIRHDTTVFQLSRRLTIGVSYEGNAWVYESKEFSIIAFGDSQSEALRSFGDDFHAVWDVIAQADDDKLTQDALLLKKRLLSIVASVHELS